MCLELFNCSKIIEDLFVQLTWMLMDLMVSLLILVGYV